MGLRGPRPPTKTHAGAGLDICYSFVANVRLGLHVGLLTSGAGLSQSLFPAIGSPYPLLGLAGWASVGEDVPRAAGTGCTRVGCSPSGAPLFCGDWKGTIGGGIHKGGTGKRGKEGGCGLDVKGIKTTKNKRTGL